MSASAISYPSFRKDDTVDVLHGTSIADPYRYLEHPDSEETQAFVSAQNKVTASVFSSYGGDPDKFEARLKELSNYERVGTVMKRGERCYVFHNQGLQNQDILYQLVSGAENLDKAPADLIASAKPFLDLNKLDPAGTTSLGASAFSEDGRFFAYGLSKSGSDWQTVRVKDTATGEDLPEEAATPLQWVKFSSIAWMKDGSGFFYSRYPPVPAVSDAGTETNATRHCCVYFHRLHTAGSDDLLVYANPDQPVWLYSTEVSDDGNYLIVKTAKGTDPVSRVYLAHLPSVWPSWLAQTKPFQLPEGGTAPPQNSTYNYLPFFRFVDNEEADYDYLTNDGRRFYWRTNLSAPKYRVVCHDLPEEAHHPSASQPVAGSADGATPSFHDVIKEDSDKVLDWATVLADDQLVLCYLKNVAAQLVRCKLPAPDAVPALSSDSAAIIAVDEEKDEIPLPGPGTIAGFSAKRHHKAFFCKYVSFLSPGQILKCAFSEGGDDGAGKAFKTSLFYDTVLPGFNPADFEASQHLVPSKDGRVKVPLFVVRKKQQGDSAPAVPPPTLCYGYGGFSISLSPSFSAMRLLWLQDIGGTYAMACLRGGGERGEDWHNDGCKHKKQNVFDDAFACAEYLIAKGISAKKRIGIMGGSNGGLLALACALQRPDLWGASVAQVPVADMLRFHKFTAGRFWCGEYGFAEENEGDFRYMLGYSPLHNVKAAKTPEEELPSMLITTADHDDRVVPLHSLKMIATLQEVAGASPHQRRPLIARIEERAGHGAGKPIAKVLREMAEIYAFLKHELTKA